ncbi:MAG: hypothetical protein KKG47_03085 [Proteobacteria bacterium]|nr:hypothetical protein [Pseudomonadota bacterium]MBU1738878.1 hypothetical protein [Pseudomonadota bacterium]
MTRSRFFIAFTIIELLVLSAFYGYSLHLGKEIRLKTLPARQNLVKRLGLTDFAIWTEARYTRHPSQADFFSPFQDFPLSLDHFPAGSMIAPATNPDRSL